MRRRTPTIALLLLALPACTGNGSRSHSSTTPTGDLTLARHRIKHIVLLIKENRTFDTMFGRFPGARGATTAPIFGTCPPAGTACERVPLMRAPDYATDVGHTFLSGLL